MNTKVKIKIRMINSKIHLKKYFLSIYLVWLFIIPIITTFLTGYMFAGEGETIFQQIQWRRVPAYFALWGIIFPITIVTAPAQYIAFEIVTGYTFFQAIPLFFVDPLAKKMVIGTLLLMIAWVGPIIHLIINTKNHYLIVKEIEEKRLKEKAKEEAKKKEDQDESEDQDKSEDQKNKKTEISFLDYLAGFL